MTGYEIFRNGTLIGTSATNSYSDTGLTASTQYSYTVEAYDGAGNLSAQSTSASVTTQAAAVWSNSSFAAQTGIFTASFDATPSQLGSDSVIGLSPTTAAAYTDLAAIVRFNSSNTIDVRNGSAYAANVSVPYSAGTSYHFVMVVDVATDTYSVYVTPQGGSQIALATNYAFRTQQATDTSLSDVADYSDVGSAPVQNLSIGPAILSLAESPSSGDLNAGKVVTITLNMTENVTVNTTGGTPTLTLNDGGTATYVSGSGSNALNFSYTVAAGQNTPDLMETAVNLNGATITDGAGNAANLSLAGLPQGSPQIDTTAPTVSSVTATAGDYNAGKALTLTLNMSEAVNVTGTPTLTLNDGGTATYVSGTGTNALTFSYTVAAGQNIAALAVTGVTGTITDLAGNALSTATLPETFTGVVVDTTAPVAPIITNDTVNSNNTVALSGTAPANDTVTVYDGQHALGTTTASAIGAWNYTTGALASGSHTLTATATDAASNTSAASNAIDPIVGATVLQTDGSTSLAQVGNNYFLFAPAR